MLKKNELLTLVTKCTRIKGRKKLQHYVYLAKMMGIILPYRFRYNSQDVYATSLEAHVDELIMDGYLKEEYCLVDNKHMYCYEVTEEGKRLIKHNQEEQSVWGIVEEATKELTDDQLEYLVLRDYFSSYDDDAFMNLLSDIQKSYLITPSNHIPMEKFKPKKEKVYS